MVFTVCAPESAGVLLYALPHDANEDDCCAEAVLDACDSCVEMVRALDPALQCPGPSRSLSAHRPS